MTAISFAVPIETKVVQTISMLKDFDRNLSMKFLKYNFFVQFALCVLGVFRKQLRKYRTFVCWFEMVAERLTLL